jgi:hypothetical protein
MTRKKAGADSAEDKGKRFQRKMAEQLAEKIGTSPDEIESGLKGFIEKSSESLGGIELKPPYRRPSWYDDFFSLIQERKVDNFSLEFIRLNIASGSEAYKLQGGLRFLGLIDMKGNPTSKLNGLRVMGESFKKNLANVILDAYSSLFQAIIIEKAKPESVINFMIEKYGYSRPLAEEATALFVYFCTKSGIPISKELSDFQITRREPTRPTSTKVKGKTPVKTAPTQEYDETFATLQSDIFSFAVKKELSAIELARDQVNSLLDYWKRKLTENSPSNIL